MHRHFRIIGLALVICILVAAAALISNAQVRTGSTSSEQTAFSFVVFGDNQPNRPNQPQSEMFKSILREIDALKPAFAVNTGDSIYGSTNKATVVKQFEEYLEVVRTHLKARVHLAVGNHEIQGSKVCEQYFTEQLGPLYYSFDHGNAHFIILNSEETGNTNRIAGEQLKWLEDDLKKSRSARHKFVFLHRPLYPVNGHRGSSMDKYPEERDALHRLFVRYRVTAVFSGHEHLFNEEVRSGVRYIINGGAGGFLYPSIHGTGDFHHFVIVNVDGRNVEMKVHKMPQGEKPSEVIPIVSK